MDNRNLWLWTVSWVLFSFFLGSYSTICEDCSQKCWDEYSEGYNDALEMRGCMPFGLPGDCAECLKLGNYMWHDGYSKGYNDVLALKDCPLNNFDVGFKEGFRDGQLIGCNDAYGGGLVDGSSAMREYFLDNWDWMCHQDKKLIYVDGVFFAFNKSIWKNVSVTWEDERDLNIEVYGFGEGYLDIMNSTVQTSISWGGSS